MQAALLCKAGGIMIIDVHAHIYPDKIAAKAVRSIGEFYQWPNMEMDGTVDGLLAASKEAGIDLSIVHSAAVSPARVKSVNDFIASTVEAHADRLLGFGSMHPDYEDIGKELDRMMAMGLRGVKLHPDTQQFMMDSPASIKMLEAMEERRLPVLIHTGDTRYPFSNPERVARALDHVPNLVAICAHLGGWSMWSNGWKILAGREDVYVDCSSSLYAITPEEAVKVIHRYGAKRVFFGTDHPMWNPVGEVKRFNALPLTEEERELILHKNIEQLLKI